jgi:branched-chain amino acid transport system permease protein
MKYGSLIFQLITNGVIEGFIHSLAAIGFSLIYNTTKIFHFAHAAAYVLIGYIFYALYAQLSFNLFPAILISLTAAAISGALIDSFLYQPLEKRRASAMVKMLSSIGFYVVLVNFLTIIFGNQPQVILENEQTVYSFYGVHITGIRLINFVISSVVGATVLIIVLKTRLGKYIQAMRDDQTVLTTLGINTQIIRYSVFAIGTCLVGVSAIMTALDAGIEPHAGMPIFIYAVIAVVIGGVARFEGALVGSIAIGVLQSFLTLFLTSNWSELAVFLTLILFLFLKPEGILGVSRRFEERAVR